MNAVPARHCCIPAWSRRYWKKQSVPESGQWREFCAGERVMARSIHSQRWLFGVMVEKNGLKSYFMQFDDGEVRNR